MRIIGLAACSAVLVAISAPVRATDEVIDMVMYKDPDIPMMRRVQVYQKGLPALWTEALGRPDDDTRSQAAITITIAKKRGVPGLEAAVPALLREIGKDDLHPVVRVSVAKALVALDVKDAAARFHALSAKASAELHEVITPALAHWNYQPARADWRAKIGGTETRQRSTLLAIQALGVVRDEEAVPRLRELALAPNESGPARIEAAKALAEIRTSGLEADARALAGEPASRKIADRLVAGHLLRRHSGPAAVETLQMIGRDPEPAAAVLALTRLIELDPKHVLPLLPVVYVSSDANVRSRGVEVLLQLPTDVHLAKLADFTNDPHPRVRVQARKALLTLAGKGHQKVVLTEGTRILGGSNWRGQEQAAILLAQLDHKPAARRLVEILPVDRGETITAAAWALRKLDVAETLPAIHEYVRTQLTLMKDKGESAGRGKVQPADMDLHLSQLFQFVGRRRFRPAEDVMREVVPPFLFGPNPTPVGYEARAAAVWALGLIHEGKPEPALTRLFVGRLTAVNPFDVEDSRVRSMSAIALGRMKAASALPQLRQFFVDKQPSQDLVNNSCGWAIEQLTGEKMLPAGIMEANDLDWFLKPIK